jgi:transposase
MMKDADFFLKVSKVAEDVVAAANTNPRVCLVCCTAEELEKFINVYRRTRSFRITAQELGISDHTARNRVDRLRDAGIDMPPTKQQSVTSEVIAEMHRLYETGMTHWQIGQQFDVSASTVRGRIRRLAVPHRTSSEYGPATAPTTAVWLKMDPVGLTPAQACLLHLYDLRRFHGQRP